MSDYWYFCSLYISTLTVLVFLVSRTFVCAWCVHARVRVLEFEMLWSSYKDRANFTVHVSLGGERERMREGEREVRETQTEICYYLIPFPTIIRNLHMY